MPEFPDLKRARALWRWRGRDRPPFAIPPKPGQESVWDYPRPPRIERDAREVVVRWGTLEVTRTRHALRVLETSHPPSFYLPWQDVARQLFEAAPGVSLCEWKGPAQYWSLVNKHGSLICAAWSYPKPLSEAKELADCVAFYAARLECSVGGAPVSPQPGGFYGGWITPELVGPFKGEPGSENW